MEIQSSSAASSQSSYTPAKKELDQDAFFKILAAQLQYQDPMSGGDNTEYVAQMAQFSALEQMQNLNASFEQMMIRQDLILGGDLIGKEVAISDGSDKLVKGVVEGFIITKNGLMFSVNDKEYPFSQIVAVKQKSEPEAPEETPEPEETPKTPEPEATPKTPEPEATPETPEPEATPETPEPKATPETPNPEETLETPQSETTPNEETPSGE